MKKFITLTSVAILSLLNIYGKKDNAKSGVPVIEIAVRSVDKQNTSKFIEKRDAFIALLTSQKGVSNDREFKSFYAMPQPDTTDVYVGMTQYSSMDVVGEIQSKPEVQQAFGAFAQTMQLKAYAFAQQTEGRKFDLSQLGKQKGQIVEVAVRRTKKGKEAEFNKLRKEFVSLLSQQNGVLESYEFKVVGGKDADGLSVGMTVYRDKESFMKIAGSITNEPLTQQYFQTFDIVASQFTYSIK